MDFNTLDKQMRRFEQSMDRTLLEGVYVVARLNGHGFTRLTKKEWDLEKPYGIRFRDAMIEAQEKEDNLDKAFELIWDDDQAQYVPFYISPLSATLMPSTIIC